jgi:hypothetical protein
MPPARLSLAHQDGGFSFRVVEAIFVVSKGLLSLSLSCAENRRHDFMGEPLFAAHNLSLGGRQPKLNQVFEVKEPFDPDSGSVDAPRAHAYLGEHFQPRGTFLVVVAATDGELALRGSFTIDDPVYYDKRAKDTPAKFFAVFAKGRRGNLWAPF